MSEKEKCDVNDVAAELKDLPKEDRFRVQGVILGLKMARKGSGLDRKKEAHT